MGIALYVFLGWLNVVLLAVMTSPFWLRFLNNRFFHLRGGTYGKTVKVLRTIHKPLGGAILIIALLHGYLALGALRLHTGVFVWLSIFTMAVLGLSFYLTKKRSLFVWHRRIALVVLFFLLVHLFFPSALYYLMN